jgi:hypothetical protein
VVVGTANTPIAVTFNYSLGEGCPVGQTCKLQLEIGTDHGGMSSCAFAGSAPGMQVGILQIAQAMGTFTGTVPIGGSNLYKIKLNGAHDGSCASSWTSGEPGDFAIIAYVCVP